MKAVSVFGISLPLLALAVALPASAASAAAAGGAPAAPPMSAAPGPFSRLGFEGGVGVGGINMQAATNISSHLNLRAVGNYFTYNVNNVTISGGGSSGAKVSGKLNFAEMGVDVDYYPWANHGFRISPGVTFLNQNAISASGAASPGSSITLNGTKYYSEQANPMNVNANLGLNLHPQTFSITTGWGNMIPHNGGHWAFPVELGAIFTGSPTLGLVLTGYGCTTQSDYSINGPSCVNMASNANAQTALNAQIAKYKSDLNVLQVYPVLTFGVSYNFRIR